MPEPKSLFARASFACAAILCLTLATAARQQTQATPQTSPTPTPEAQASPTPVHPEDAAIETKSFERLEWRNIGPANMGGRIADVEGVAGRPDIVYVATASGGLFKTTNGGGRRSKSATRC